MTIVIATCAFKVCSHNMCYTNPFKALVRSANGEIKASCFCSGENKTGISLDTRRRGYALKDKSGVWGIMLRLSYIAP